MVMDSENKMANCIAEKVINELNGKNWILLNQYKNKYPMNWVRTINKCLEDDENLYEFKYDSKGELKQIRIITNYGECGSEWNYYIRFEY